MAQSAKPDALPLPHAGGDLHDQLLGALSKEIRVRPPGGRQARVYINVVPDVACYVSNYVIPLASFNLIS